MPQPPDRHHSSAIIRGKSPSDRTRRGCLLLSVAAIILSGTPGVFGQIKEYDTLVLADHPASYWPLNETSGAVIHDMAGTNNGICINPDGLFLGSPGILSAQGETAVYFINTNHGYIYVPYSSTLNTPQFTIELWLNLPVFPVAKAQADMNPLTMNRAEPAKGWAFDIQLANASNPHLLGWLADNDWTQLNSGQCLQGQWAHYAMTYDGNTFSIYTNGVLAASKPSGYARVSPGHPLYIGAYNETGAADRVDRFYRGAMEKVAVYAYALTADRLLDHYLCIKTNRAWPGRKKRLRHSRRFLNPGEKCAVSIPPDQDAFAF